MSIQARAGANRIHFSGKVSGKKLPRGSYVVTITATNGKVKLSTMNGLTRVSGANSSASITVKGALSALNAALSGLVFTPTSGYTGSGAAQTAVTETIKVAATAMRRARFNMRKSPYLVE